MAVVGHSSSHKIKRSHLSCCRLGDSVHQLLLVRGGKAINIQELRVTDIMLLRSLRAVYGELITNFLQL